MIANYHYSQYTAFTVLSAPFFYTDNRGAYDSSMYKIEPWSTNLIVQMQHVDVSKHKDPLASRGFFYLQICFLWFLLSCKLPLTCPGF